MKWHTCIKSLLLFVFFTLSIFQLGAQDEIVKKFQQMIENVEDYTSTEIILIYNEYAQSHYDYGLDSVNQLFQEMIDFGVKHNEPLVQCSGYQNMGEIYRMLGNDEKALKALLKGLRVPNVDDWNKMQNYYGTAGIYAKMGEVDSLKVYMDSTKMKLDITKDTVFYLPYYILEGGYFAKKGQYHSALDAYIESLNHITTETSPLKVINVYNNISSMFSYLDDYENAIKYLDFTEEIAIKQNYPRTLNMIKIKKGRLFMKQELFDQALFSLQAAIPYAEEKGLKNRLVDIYANKTISHIELGQISKAKLAFDNINDEMLEGISSANLSTYYNAQFRLAQAEKRYSDSKAPLNQILDAAKQSNNLKNEINALEGLGRAYAGLGDFKRAYEYQDQAKTKIKALNANETKDLLYDLENKYQTALNEAKINALEAKNELNTLQIQKKKRENTLYLILMSMLLLGLAAGAYALIKIRNNNALLTIANTKLQKSLATNKMLLKEIHHRVKNNLQVISSLLGLQLMHVNDDASKKAILTSKTRVQSMALLHQKLYQKEDLQLVDIQEYFENLLLNLFQAYKVDQSNVVLIKDIDPIELDVDRVITMGLIFNELVSNALKYAFKKDEQGKIEVEIKREGDKIRMTVRDDGIGISSTELSANSKSLGMKLIISFSEKLNANLNIDGNDGTEVDITFPIKKSA